MTFLSILIALLIERILPQLVELRRFLWLRDYVIKIDFAWRRL